MKNKLMTGVMTFVLFCGFLVFNCVGDSWGATVRMSQSNYDVNETIVVTYEDLPGTSGDFICIYVSGSPDLFYLQGKYTSGNESGTMTFSASSFVPGSEYEARVFSGSFYNRLCNTYFTVGDNDIEKVITNRHRKLANLAGRAYPGYFDAISGALTLFTVSNIDFNDNTSEYSTVKNWGGNPDEFIGEVPFGTSGCDAVLYKNTNTGNYVLAFRGTTAQFQDLIEDFRLLFHPPSGVFGDYYQFIDADEIVQELIATYGSNILNKLEITGHSLGGAIAQAIGLKYGLPTIAFNAVGVPDQALSAIDVSKNSTFWNNADDVMNINVCGDPMSDWNWNQDAYSFWDTLPRYGKNYWLPAKYTLSLFRLRNHFYNVIVNQMDRYSTMELGQSIY